MEEGDTAVLFDGKTEIVVAEETPQCWDMTEPQPHVLDLDVVAPENTATTPTVPSLQGQTTVSTDSDMGLKQEIQTPETETAVNTHSDMGLKQEIQTLETKLEDKIINSTDMKQDMEEHLSDCVGDLSNSSVSSTDCMKNCMPTVCEADIQEKHDTVPTYKSASFEFGYLNQHNANKHAGDKQDVAVFTLLSDLKQHMLKDQEEQHWEGFMLGPPSREKKHACEECGVRFAKSSTLKQHMFTHTGEKKYACTECNGRFSQSGHLKRHMLTHTREKKHACTACDARFALSSTLKQHILTHAEDKKYACTECGARFSQLRSLLSHMSTHTGEKKYACTSCDAKFRLSKTLKRHILTHTEEEKHACTVCDARFARSSTLKLHMMLKHTGKKKSLHV